MGIYLNSSSNKFVEQRIYAARWLNSENEIKIAELNGGWWSERMIYC